MEKRRNRFYFIPVILAVILLLALIVMLLWNAILPQLIRVHPVTYPQALGLLILCKILFGSFRPGPRGFRKGGSPWRSKLMDLTPEEREQFKQEWQKRAACKKQE